MRHELALDGPSIGLVPGVNLHEEGLAYCDEILRRLPWPDAESARPLRTLGITSCSRGEGVSTAAAHLAAAAASRPRMRVLLVDGNLASPAVARIFSVAEAPGLAECLLGGEEAPGAVQASPVERLWVMAAGRLPCSPAQLYDSPYFAPLLKELASQFDLVVFDLPAVSQASCTFRLAGLLDGVLLVMEADQAVCDVAQRAMELLRRADARLLGALVNKARDNLFFRYGTNLQCNGELPEQNSAMVASPLTRLLSETMGPTHPEQPPTFRELQSVESFRAIVARERARADRYDGQFSLLCFAVEDAQTDLPTLSHTAKIVRDRIRDTDEAGWLDCRTIGVILPNTPRWGAWTVADNVCSSFSAGVPLPECRVSCYPSDWLSDNRRKDCHSHRKRQPSRRRLPTPVMDALMVEAMPPWKRALDILGASFGLLLLSPLFALTAAAVKLTSAGPVLFKQRRLGLGGKPFTMYKFRTMVVDAEEQQTELMNLNEQQGPVFKIRNDPRVTRLGRALRKTSIDELPQLWNVLKGEMSLVGPRPPLDKEVRQYELWHRRRLDVTPGLTCIWQVSGRSHVGFTEWIRMDVRYIRSRSLTKDLGLLLRTLPAVIFHRGAS